MKQRAVGKRGKVGRVIADPARSENAPVSAAGGVLAWVWRDPPPMRSRPRL